MAGEPQQAVTICLCRKRATDVLAGSLLKLWDRRREVVIIGSVWQRLPGFLHC